MKTTSLSDKLQCKWCEKHIYHKGLKRHNRDSCSNIPEAIRNKYIKKYKKYKKHITTLATTTENRVVTEVQTIQNNTNNTILNNTTINNNNNNVFIKINPLGQEDTSFLTKEDKIQILERMYNGVPELIKKLHSHPANRNFFLPNVNKNVVAYLNNDNELQYDVKNDICRQIIDDNIDRLDDFFNEFKTEVKTTMKDRIEKIMDKNQDNANHDKYFNDVNVFLLNISKKNRKDLNIYLDKLEVEMG